MDIGPGLNHLNEISLSLLMICFFERNWCPPPLWTSQSGWPIQAHPALHAKLSARPLKPANHQGTTSKSYQFRIPVPEVATSWHCQFGNKKDPARAKRSDPIGGPPLRRGCSGIRKGFSFPINQLEEGAFGISGPPLPAHSKPLHL